MSSDSEIMATCAFVSHVQNRAGGSFTVVTDLRGEFSGAPFLLTELHAPVSAKDFAFDMPLCGFRAAVVTAMLGTPRLP